MREGLEAVDLALTRRQFLRAGLGGVAAGSVWRTLPGAAQAAAGGALVATAPGDLQFDP